MDGRNRLQGNPCRGRPQDPGVLEPCARLRPGAPGGSPRRQVVAVQPNQTADSVTPAIGGTRCRIVMMPAATIIGMLARTHGSMAPWLILIGLKTLSDDQRPDRKPDAHR